MYCQECGKEIEKGLEKCPHCGSVIPNVFVPNLFNQDKESDEKQETPQLIVKARKKDKAPKKPSMLSIRITSIVCFGVGVAYFIAKLISMLAGNIVTDKPLSKLLCIYSYAMNGVLFALFGVMLALSIAGKIKKQLAGATLLSFNVSQIAYCVMVITSNIIALTQTDNLRASWFIILDVVLKLSVAIIFTIVSIFTILFYFKKIFSPLPMCITSGIFLIFELFSFIALIITYAMRLLPADGIEIIYYINIFALYGITIAQVFIYNKHDKYKRWVRQNAVG